MIPSISREDFRRRRHPYSSRQLRTLLAVLGYGALFLGLLIAFLAHRKHSAALWATVCGYLLASAVLLTARQILVQWGIVRRHWRRRQHSRLLRGFRP